MSDPGRTIAGTAAILVALVVTAVAVLAVGADDPARRVAVAVTAVAVGAGAVSGWLVGRWSRGQPPALAAAGALGATLARLFPGLATLAWIVTSEGGVREAGGAGLLVIFYLATLAVDIALNMMDRPKSGPRGGADRGI